MILQENGTRFCTEGKVFTIGGIICANDESEYAGLCGTVTEIRSGDDHETENDTPDIYCAFDPPTSENMVLELESRFSALYGEPKTMDDIALDSVIMAPEMLEPSAEPPAEGVDLSGKMEVVAGIFAKVLQMPDGDLRALRAFPCAPADEEAASWEVVTEVCSLGGCDMSVYSFENERSARLFAALLKRTGCRLRYDAACPRCYTEYQRAILKESEDTVVLWDVRMTSAELKHRAELQEWAAQIQECRSSGLSVSEWCRQQGVTTTLLASFSGIPLSFAEAQILPSKKTVKMLRSGLKK